MIDIRLCRRRDIDAVMAFIDQHWRKGHVLATSRALMDWQYRAGEDSYDILLASAGDEVLAVLGFIRASRYDPTLSGAETVWLALWKVREDVRIAGLGLRMLRDLERRVGAETIAVNGINATHPPMYRAMGYQTGVLRHHYMVDRAREPRLVIANRGAKRLPSPNPGSAAVQIMDETSLRELDWRRDGRGKSPDYFIERYLRHPFYDYQVHVLSQGDQKALLATRLAEVGSASVIRVVDFAGDVGVLAEAGDVFGALMRRAAAEHVDFLNAGLPDGLLEAAGFAALDFDGPVTVPNRFEPLEMKNRRVHFAFKTTRAAPMLIFRADGDQDRPNVL